MPKLLSKKKARPQKRERDAASNSSRPKPLSARARRVLRKREPQLVETVKNTMFIRGHSSSQTMTEVLSDLSVLKRPDCVNYRHRNQILPFENDASLEFFSSKTDCSLFALGSHTKKRPNNMVLGRLYDHHLLDMLEFGVENFQSIRALKNAAWQAGSKPCLLFQGPEFDQDVELSAVKSMLLDFFRGQLAEAVNLAGLDHVIVFTTVPDSKTVLLRHYAVELKRSGTRLPRVELSLVGPSMDLKLRRTRIAAPDVMKAACKKPQSEMPHKKKNISTTPLGERVGRIHMGRQPLSELAIKKTKALLTRKGNPAGVAPVPVPSADDGSD